MTNKPNGERNIAVIVVAIVATVAIMLGGLISGLVLAMDVRRENSPAEWEGNIASYLLVDAASGLRRSMSALRLCTDAAPAEDIGRAALVYAARAETALECREDHWAESRSREAFLNDISAALYSNDGTKSMEMADEMYKYADLFYRSLMSGATFEYNGELANDGSTPSPQTEHDKVDANKAEELVVSALGADKCEYAGEWSGHVEFNVERDGKTGYAVVCGNKIKEYAFVRDDKMQSPQKAIAERIALEGAAACGYADLVVKHCETSDSAVRVIMCKCYDGAVACDDTATAVVCGNELSAFFAGDCDCVHKDIPKPRKTEEQARRAVRGTNQKGTLVVRKKNGKERICYEYRFESEDGTHYVYVCAESGKQIEVL